MTRTKWCRVTGGRVAELGLSPGPPDRARATPQPAFLFSQFLLFVPEEQNAFCVKLEDLSI